MVTAGYGTADADGAHEALLPSFGGNPLRRLARVAFLWRSRMSTLSWPQIAVALLVSLVALTANQMMFFGMNFWLHSLTAQSSIYTTLLLPALLWAGLFLLPIPVWKAVRPKEPLRWVFTRPAMVYLVVIGVVDALGGFTYAYGANYTPLFLQSMMMATGPMWTYLCCSLFAPHRVTHRSRWIFLSFGLVLAAVAISAIPEVQFVSTPSGGSFAWWLIFLVSAWLPPTFNVLQAAFMDRFSPEAVDGASPWTVKLVLLAGDCTVQAVATALLWPLDAAPWFGSAPSLAASWAGNKASLECLTVCPGAAAYMLIYVAGYFMGHVACTFLNQYSPTLGAMVLQLTSPIFSVLLFAIPSWNIYGAATTWRYQGTATVLLVVAAALYIVLEESDREEKRLSSTSSEASNGRSRENSIGPGGAAAVQGIVVVGQTGDTGATTA